MWAVHGIEFDHDSLRDNAVHPPLRRSRFRTCQFDDVHVNLYLMPKGPPAGRCTHSSLHSPLVEARGAL
jgi:hypothetical protein